MAKNRPGIIIQARMSSTRLPNKAMLYLHGKPALGHVIQRCSATGLPVVVATSTEQSDDVIEAFTASLGVPCFRGSLDDVLGRFRACASQYDFDPIIRITADCPFISPAAILSTLQSFSGIYTSYEGRKGWDVEVFSYKELVEAQDAGPDEHVTTRMREGKTFPEPTGEPLVLDTPEDYYRLFTATPLD